MERNAFAKRLITLLQKNYMELTLLGGAALVIFGLLLLIQGLSDSGTFTWGFLLPVSGGLGVMVLVEILGRR